MSKRRYQVKAACGHCRKKHAGCDEKRPCTRCIRLGLSDTCSDAPRKRKKVDDYSDFLHSKCDDPPAFTSVSSFGSYRHINQKVFDQDDSIGSSSTDVVVRQIEEDLPTDIVTLKTSSIYQNDNVGQPQPTTLFCEVKPQLPYGHRDSHHHESPTRPNAPSRNTSPAAARCEDNPVQIKGDPSPYSSPSHSHSSSSPNSPHSPSSSFHFQTSPFPEPMSFVPPSNPPVYSTPFPPVTAPLDPPPNPSISSLPQNSQQSSQPDTSFPKTNDSTLTTEPALPLHLQPVPKNIEVEIADCGSQAYEFSPLDTFDIGSSTTLYKRRHDPLLASSGGFGSLSSWNLSNNFLSLSGGLMSGGLLSGGLMSSLSKSDWPKNSSEDMQIPSEEFLGTLFV